MTNKNKKRGFTGRLFHRIFKGQKEAFYGPHQPLAGIPHQEPEKPAKRKNKPDASGPKPVSRETLAANQLNQNLSRQPEQPVNQDPLPVNPDRARPAFPVKQVAKPGKRKSLLKRLLKRSKKRQEEPAIKIEKPRPERLNQVLRSEIRPMLNSLGLFLLSYMVVYFIYQFAAIIAASGFGIDSVLYYYELYFPIGNYSPLWSRLNIIAITFISPLISLGIAIILLRGILPREKPGVQARLFFLWTAYHGATHFLGAFVAGIVTDLGFGYVANWLYMNVSIKLLISLVFLFILVVTGYHSTRFAIETIAPAQRNNKSRVRKALFFRFLLPWLIGAALLIIVKTPDATPQHEDIMIYDTVIIASMGFLVIPLLFNQKARPRPFGNRMNYYRKPYAYIVLLTSLLTLAIFRLLLSHGLHFVIRFSFDVGFYK
ncbi:hypothetical protein SDC9_22646 [bioreactor metagenome]|jgi:hypothetical protein|uniref:Uncharacterized protein n=1 Tax=bioreactor metagenome TaxID=1076179 RepID=A0A644UCR4_9ZZZZ|nr:hypothetical protein [Lentimicrobium sp.]MEA5111900.1 hypothetical protein [Lentimicrobium sp.]